MRTAFATSVVYATGVSAFLVTGSPLAAAAGLLALVAVGFGTGARAAVWTPLFLSAALAVLALAVDVAAPGGEGDDWTPLVAVFLTVAGAIGTGAVAAGAALRPSPAASSG